MIPTGVDSLSDVVPTATGRGAIPFAKIGVGVVVLLALVLIGREVVVRLVHPLDFGPPVRSGRTSPHA